MSTTQQIITDFVSQNVSHHAASTYADRINRLASQIDGGQVEVNAALAQANREANAGLSEQMLARLADEIETSDTVSPFEGAETGTVEQGDDSLFLTDAQADVILSIAEEAGMPRNHAFEALVQAGLMEAPEVEAEDDDENDDEQVSMATVMEAIADMGKTLQSLVKAAQDNGIRLS